MMEFVFIFPPSYFSIIFSVKGKISKSVSLFLSRIGPKRCWPIRLQDVKLNISFEQSDEIVCFFTGWYQKLRVDRKSWGECGQKWLWPPWSQGEWINEWLNWAYFLHADANSGKLRITLINFRWLWSKMGMGL